jgi:alkylation response protein AidB-like acyl-CoA dehydrogenase
MELVLTDDQTLFHDTAVHFIETEMPVEAVRAFHDDSVGFERGWLQDTAALGWYTMLVDEDDGGGSVSGSSVVDAAIVAEELGRHVQPGPFIEMNVVAAALSSFGGPSQKEQWLPGIMAGETVATWAFAASSGVWDEGFGVTAIPVGDGYRLDGLRGFVSYGADADLLLVAANLEGRPAQFLVTTDAQGLMHRRLDCLDLGRRMAHVTFEAVAVPSEALLDVEDGRGALDHQLNVALALLVADSVGAMDALLSMTVQYSKDRIAFGRPIGSFQALKHVLADTAVDLETCKAGSTALARAVDSGSEDATEVASMVAAYVGERSDHAAQVALQLHGGIGYTWEHDLHLFMRRIRSNASLFGEPSWHRERVCRFHGLGERGGR